MIFFNCLNGENIFHSTCVFWCILVQMSFIVSLTLVPPKLSGMQDRFGSCPDFQIWGRLICLIYMQHSIILEVLVLHSLVSRAHGGAGGHRGTGKRWQATPSPRRLVKFTGLQATSMMWLEERACSPPLPPRVTLPKVSKIPSLKKPGFPRMHEPLEKSPAHGSPFELCSWFYRDNKPLGRQEAIHYPTGSP